VCAKNVRFASITRRLVQEKEIIQDACTEQKKMEERIFKVKTPTTEKE
jgi:hypothetical protein